MFRKLGRAFVAFWRVLRPKQEAPGTLREFVYLDETSVESLLASLDGEILTGITESRSKGNEIGVAATGDVVGIPTGLSSSFSRSRSTTVEEQRKSVAQSAFARFRSRHYKNLRIHASDPGDDRPAALEVPLKNLNRGDLIEVDAKLGASEVFQVRAVIDSMMGVVDAYPNMMGTGEITAVKDAAPLSELLGRLSHGLIPVEGVVQGLRLVHHEGFDKIVTVDQAIRLQEQGAAVREVVVAGVSLEPLYWQDVRRVLFSNQTFRVLGRLVNNGARNSWSSLKIAEVLSRVSPQLADTINSLGPMFLTTLHAGAEGAPSNNPSQARAHETLRTYAVECATVMGVTPSAQLMSAIDELISTSSTPMSVSAWSELQKSLAALVTADAQETLDPDTLLDLRAKFPQPVDLAPSVSAFATQSQLTHVAEPGPAYLEVEIIAIYW